MLDCSEVSIEKDPTLKNIVAKYEQEIKVHVRLEHELKAIVKQHESKMKEKDEAVQELQAAIEVRWTNAETKARNQDSAETKFRAQFQPARRNQAKTQDLQAPEEIHRLPIGGLPRSSRSPN